MRAFRAFFRLVKLGLYFLRFGLELLVRRPASRELQADWLHRFCAAVLRGFEVELTIQGEFPARGALISNHLGYLDILVFAAMHPCVFCSKAEVEKMPVLGWFATMSGTVFVERGAGGSAARAGVGMQAAAAAGIPVVFFPEGTTSNGEGLLPFHSGLIAQALEADQPVTAAFLSYTLDQDNGPDVLVRDQVHFWGHAVSMGAHIFRFLGLQGAHAHVTIASAPIAFTHGADERKEATEEAREAVLALAPEHVRTGQAQS